MTFDREYSSRRGDSLYPLHAGAVVKLKSSVSKKRAGISLSGPDDEHQMFFWIQHISARQPTAYQERLARIMVVLIPRNSDRAQDRVIYELTEDDRLQLETLKKWMRVWGYEHLGDLPFRQRRRDYGKFYELIGIQKTFKPTRVSRTNSII